MKAITFLGISCASDPGVKIEEQKKLKAEIRDIEEWKV